MNTKVDSKLRTLMEKAGDADMSFEVGLVVTPTQEHAGEPLAKKIEDAGGKIISQQNDRLQCNVPLSRVSDLAEGEEVSSIRLTRLHHMHAR